MSPTKSGDETTRVGTWPRFRSMRGPYFLESASRERCGNFPSWWRFPIIGSLGGEGGKLCFLPKMFWMKKRKERRRRKTERKKGLMSSSVC